MAKSKQLVSPSGSNFGKLGVLKSNFARFNGNQAPSERTRSFQRVHTNQITPASISASTTR
jgi:hypothetical protein